MFTLGLCPFVSIRFQVDGEEQMMPQKLLRYYAPGATRYIVALSYFSGQLVLHLSISKMITFQIFQHWVYTGEINMDGFTEDRMSEYCNLAILMEEISVDGKLKSVYFTSLRRFFDDTHSDGNLTPLKNEHFKMLGKQMEDKGHRIFYVLHKELKRALSVLDDETRATYKDNLPVINDDVAFRVIFLDDVTQGARMLAAGVKY